MRVGHSVIEFFLVSIAGRDNGKIYQDNRKSITLSTINSDKFINR